MTQGLASSLDSAQELRLSIELLVSVLEKLLTKNSVFQFDAATTARRLVEADLYGIPEEGSRRIRDILESLALGDIDPRGKVLTLTEAPAFAVLDGSRAIGAVAATKGAELAAAKAAESGIAVTAVGNSQPLGAAEVFARLVADAGMIALCISSSGGPTVAWPGSNEGALGNTAFAFAVPVTGGSPVLYGTSTGSVSEGMLGLLKSYGLPVPEGSGRDSAGRDAYAPEAVGVLHPRGGELGAALSILCSVLAGPLCGGWMPIHKRRRASSEDSQHVFMALNIDAFCDRKKFDGELGRTLTELRELPPADPDRPVQLPGDLSAACFTECSRYGVPVHRDVVNDLRSLAAKQKIEWPEGLVMSDEA